jgi:hypothetical protein
MERILKEPLLHFLLLGAGLFLAYSLASTRRSDEPGRIVVTQGQIEHLAATFAKVWQRPPTPEELTALVRDRVREEVCCREAIAIGLDKDDTVIRRRLRQKMEFVSDDLAAPPEPTDADLNAFLLARPDSFRIEPRLTFRQVYLNPKNHRENLARDAAHLLALLHQSDGTVDPRALGESSLLEHEFAAVRAGEVAKQFGGKFSESLLELSLGQWQGPIESGYGMHLVLVSERTKGRLPALTEVRDAVYREWANARRQEANEEFYQNLLKRYEVIIEKQEENKKLAQAR